MIQPTDLKVPAIGARHWPLPLVFTHTLSIWMHWFEPAVFSFPNEKLNMAPSMVWSLFSPLGTGWCVYAIALPFQLALFFIAASSVRLRRSHEFVGEQ